MDKWIALKRAWRARPPAPDGKLVKGKRVPNGKLVRELFESVVAKKVESLKESVDTSIGLITEQKDYRKYAEARNSVNLKRLTMWKQIQRRCLQQPNDLVGLKMCFGPLANAPLRLNYLLPFNYGHPDKPLTKTQQRVRERQRRSDSGHNTDTDDDDDQDEENSY